MFDILSHLHPSLQLEAKVKYYRVAPILAHKQQTRVEDANNDKHTSLKTKL